MAFIWNDDIDYNFFNEVFKFTDKIDRLFTPKYSLKIKVSNYDDNNTIEVSTEPMQSVQELPQSIPELVHKYDIIKHYIHCYTDDFYLHFDIKFICSSGECFSQFYSISVCKLKKMGDISYCSKNS
jgi:hypothetical protein